MHDLVGSWSEIVIIAFEVNVRLILECLKHIFTEDTSKVL